MFDFTAILKANPNGVLATRDGEKVRTRVFQFLFTEGKAVYFCTSCEKPVYAQLCENPNVSFCTFSRSYNPVLMITGCVEFTDDIAYKARAMNENPGIKKLYGSPDNPLFKLFYIKPETVETFNLSEGLRSHPV